MRAHIHTLAALTILALSILSRSALAVPTIRGLEGQPSLRLDIGKSLDGMRLTRRRDRRRVEALQPIEKARLDGRRLLLAAKLPVPAALERIVRIVQQRLPYASDAVYDAFNERHVTLDGAVDLSAYVKAHVGICRERAFLLATMLTDGGLDAKVQYGVVYDRRGKQLGGHAWVEATVDGKPTRIDASASQPVTIGTHAVQIVETVAGRQHTVEGTRSRSLLYVPTKDLHLQL